MYDVQKVIFDANVLSKEYLLHKDLNCIELSIPKLVVYMTILRMRKWLDDKASDWARTAKDKARMESKRKPIEHDDEADKQ